MQSNYLITVDSEEAEVDVQSKLKVACKIKKHKLVVEFTRN